MNKVYRIGGIFSRRFCIVDRFDEMYDMNRDGELDEREEVFAEFERLDEFDRLYRDKEKTLEEELDDFLDDDMDDDF